MILVGITLFLILIGLGFFAYGAIALSKYAFRMGTGPGLMTLLFPPYTIYFALFKLEEDGKSWPTASWLFGIVVSVMLCIAFYPDLNALASGDMERFETATGTAETAAQAVEEANAAEEAAAEQAAAEVAEEAAAESEEEEGAAGEEADGEEAASDQADGEAAEEAAAAE